MGEYEYDDPHMYDRRGATCQETIETALNNYPDYEFRCSGQSIERRRRRAYKEEWYEWTMVYRCPEHT